MALTIEPTGLWELCFVRVGLFGLFLLKMNGCDSSMSSLAIADVYASIYHMHKRGETPNITWDLVCVWMWELFIYFLALPTQVLCARQSPCQYCGLHHLSGLAWGHRQSFVWLRLDFVVDQWDLGGQTVCHCILPCAQPKFCLFFADSLLLPAWLLSVAVLLHLGCGSKTYPTNREWWYKLQDLEAIQD